MTKLIRVGFFRETAHGEQGDASLAEVRTESPAEHQEALAAYLDAGHVYLATPAIAIDVLDGRTPIGSPHYLTDGRYVWPGDAAHYVRTYHARLPDAFVAHAQTRGWTVPETVDLTTISL